MQEKLTVTKYFITTKANTNRDNDQIYLRVTGFTSRWLHLRLKGTGGRGLDAAPTVEQPLSLKEHAYSDVLQLVVAAQLEHRKHRQPHPAGPRCPCTKLEQQITYVVLWNGLSDWVQK